MRTEPGPMKARCIACGGPMSAVRFGYAGFIPQCNDCHRTPADAFLHIGQKIGQTAQMQKAIK